jgi:hypothetical protein
MDFTIRRYVELLKTLQSKGFLLQPFNEFSNGDTKMVITLRQDVDHLPKNSLEFARIQSEYGIRSTFYFRLVPMSFDEAVIRVIEEMGHEIGYHYETMDSCKGNIDKAYSLFCENLEKLRKLVPVATICMHGSPLSKYDNRLIWEKYDYLALGLIGEPYFDVDFDKVLYLTDTGRRWDGGDVSVRDKVMKKKEREKGRGGERERGRLGDKETQSPFTIAPSHRHTVTPSHRRTVTPSDRHTVAPFPKFHSTFDIINAANEGSLPDQIMMTFHPQRWTDKPLPWMKELVWQNVKNVGKYFLVKIR